MVLMSTLRPVARGCPPIPRTTRLKTAHPRQDADWDAYGDPVHFLFSSRRQIRPQYPHPTTRRASSSPLTPAPAPRYDGPSARRPSYHPPLEASPARPSRSGLDGADRAVRVRDQDHHLLENRRDSPSPARAQCTGFTSSRRLPRQCPLEGARPRSDETHLLRSVPELRRSSRGVPAYAQRVTRIARQLVDARSIRGHFASSPRHRPCTDGVVLVPGSFRAPWCGT